MSIPLQFASLYDGQEVFDRKACETVAIGDEAERSARDHLLHAYLLTFSVCLYRKASQGAGAGGSQQAEKPGSKTCQWPISPEGFYYVVNPAPSGSSSGSEATTPGIVGWLTHGH